MREVVGEVWIPAKGEEPSRYPSTYRSHILGIAEPVFHEAHTATVRVLDVPDDISEGTALELARVIIRSGGGFPARVTWKALLRDADRFELIVCKEARK